MNIKNYEAVYTNTKNRKSIITILYRESIVQYFNV
jgi:hypothetical protein